MNEPASSRQRRDGWWNYCQRCGRRYWCRASEVGLAHQSRYQDDETSKKHECGPAVAT